MPKIAEFCLEYEKPVGKVYRSGVFLFLDYIYSHSRVGKIATKDEMQKYESLMDKYFAENRNVTNDIMAFRGAMRDKLAPKTLRVYLSGLKSFFIHYDVDFSMKDLMKLKKNQPKNKARTVEAQLDAPTLRRIIQHLDIPMRAIVMIMASSGIRPGEALQITPAEVNTKTRQITVRAEFAKNGEQRYTFYSKEAAEVFDEYLKMRPQYLADLAARITTPAKRVEKLKDTRIFPVSDEIVRQNLIEALKKAELYNVDSGTSRTDIHAHMFRKFFYSQLRLGAPQGIVDLLMGHTTELAKAYGHNTPSQIREIYEKNEHFLSITSAVDTGAIRAEYDDKYNTMLRENQAMRENMDKISSQLRDYERVLSVLTGKPVGKRDENYTRVPTIE